MGHLSPPLPAPPPPTASRARRAQGKEKAEQATHPQLPAADFHVALLDYVVKVGGHGQHVRLPRIESRRLPRGPRRSRIQPAAANSRAAAWCPGAPTAGDEGWVAGRPRSGNAARRRREQPLPSAFGSSPSPPAASRARPAPPPAAGAPSAPPPRQHPRAGASLGGAQLAGAHHRGFPARGEGRAGGAGRSAGLAPSPWPAGWLGLKMLARRAPSLATRAGSSSRHPRPVSRSHPTSYARSALPGAGFLRTGLLIPGLLVSTPKLDTGKGRRGCSQERRPAGARQLFISMAMFTVHFYS